ncbi:5-deoxy-glucuronate isomerase [Candidatus Hydrogenedentota bacterium]
MHLLRKNTLLHPGYTAVVGGEDFPLKYLRMGRLFLNGDVQSYEDNSGEDEIVMSVISGICTVHVDGAEPWENVGDRESFFDGPPTMAYIPRHRNWHVRIVSDELHALMFRASARRDTAPALVRCDEAKEVNIGRDTWHRSAWMVIADNVDADRLIVGETRNAPGQWSSYPPHKHDASAPPKEEWYEEIYHFAVEPKQGFGIQRIYTAPTDPEPLDEVYVVRDGDSVAIPRGYHPVSAAGGYSVGYVWALAGEERAFGAWSVDPDHDWIG